MKKAILGAALALLVGCSGTKSRDAGSHNVINGGGFSFEGGAAYCISHRDEYSTCLKLNADMQITAGNDISKVWTNAYREGRRDAILLEQAGQGKAMHYVTSNEMCVLGNVTGVSLIAKDMQNNQSEHLFKEVDCGTLDEMVKQ